MKKKCVSLLVFLTINLFVSLAIAVDTPPLPPMPGVGGINPGNLEKYNEAITNINRVDYQNASYLKQEWGKILEKNKFIGPLIISYNNNISPILNPAVRFVLGIEPSLSWLFILSVVMWIFFIIFLYRISDILPFGNITNVILLVASALLITIIRIPTRISESIVNSFIKISEIWWLQLILIAILIIILMTLVIFSKAISQLLKQTKEKREKSKEKSNREKLEKEIETARIYTKRALR